MGDRNHAVIEEFRRNGGVVGGPFTGRPLLLLHTIGRRTGIERVTPLTYLAHKGRIFVFASNAGADHHPAWYRNLSTRNVVTYEIGDETRTATARELTGPERDEIFARQVDVWDIFGRYEAGTDRTIPVVELA